MQGKIISINYVAISFETILIVNLLKIANKLFQKEWHEISKGKLEDEKAMWEDVPSRSACLSA